MSLQVGNGTCHATCSKAELEVQPSTDYPEDESKSGALEPQLRAEALHLAPGVGILIRLTLNTTTRTNPKCEIQTAP